MAGKHAVFSPSGADGWMNCAGKVLMERGRPDRSSKAADEGTAAHFIAADCLDRKANANTYLGRTASVCVEIATGDEVVLIDNKNFKDYEHRNVFVVDSDMVMHIQTYLDTVREYAKDGELFVEYSLPIDHLTWEEGAEGTLDAHIVKGDEIIVIDLKFGHTPVKADCKQLKIYALAALEEYSILHDIQTVRLVISQPRVFDDPSEHIMTVDELLAFREEVEARAVEAASVFLEDDGMVADKYLTAGEAQCKYCKAKLDCRVFNKGSNDVVELEFEVIDHKGETPLLDLSPAAQVGAIDNLVKNYSPERLNDMANMLPLIKLWCKAVEAERDHYLLEENGQLADWKVVQSQDGNRQWENDAAAEAVMKRMKIKEDQMYTKKIVTAPQAEKLFKSKVIGPRQWPVLQELIIRKKGGKTVVPASDKRPAITHVVDQFDVIDGESEVVENDIDEFL